MRKRRLKVGFENITGDQVEASLLIPDVRLSRKLAEMMGNEDELISEALELLRVKVTVNGEDLPNEDLGVDEINRIWEDYHDTLAVASKKPTS